MKLKNVCVAVVALALAVGMTACGSASSTAASSSEAASTSTSVAAESEEDASSAVAEENGSSSEAASSEAASSEAASSEAASSEAAEPTTAEYTVYNTTGSTVTELYLYDAGSDEKGDNLAGENGLADGENIVITRDVEADKQSDVTYILEFTTEDGQTQSFETLHYEVAPISLLSVDAAAGATPIAFTAPEK